MDGFFKKKNPQAQKSKLENLELAKNVVWMSIGARMPACNMAAANLCIGASEMPNAEHLHGIADVCICPCSNCAAGCWETTVRHVGPKRRMIDCLRKQLNWQECINFPKKVFSGNYPPPLSCAGRDNFCFEIKEL